MKNTNTDKALKKWKQLKLDRVSKYNLNPKLCKQCNGPISYEKMINKNAFCSHSCSAKYNNIRRERNKWAKIHYCPICNKVTPSRESIFCEPYGK